MTIERENDQDKYTLSLEEQLARRLTALHKQRRSAPPRTLPLKLHNPGNSKTEALLECHEYVTNFMVWVLQQWEEYPDHPREDGAFAQVLSILNLNLPNPTYVLSLRLAAYCKLLLPKDYRFSSRLRDACYRECARLIWLWVKSVLKRIPRPKKGEQMRIDAEILHREWQKQHAKYRSALLLPIPFGRDEGKCLYEVMKRKKEARWLLERLLTHEEIEGLLKSVQKLLEGNPVEAARAGSTVVPIRQKRRHKRKTQQSWALQRILDPEREIVVLGYLRRDEIVEVTKELEEMHEIDEAARESLRTLYSIAEATQQEMEGFEDMRDVLRTFLYEKPPTYPSIREVELMTLEEHVALEDEYRASLEALANVPFPEEQEEFEWIEVEQRTTWNLLRTAATIDHTARQSRVTARTVDEEVHLDNNEAKLQNALRRVKRPKLQPITFIGSMSPTIGNRDFALLYERRENHETKAWLYSFVLVVAIHGQHAEKKFHPNIRNLCFINYPGVPFVPPKSASIMVFPLECGRKQHDLLRSVIEHREREQQRGKKGNLPITFARIVCRPNKQGEPEFFVHLSVKQPLPERLPVPTRVLGFHEHEMGYRPAEAWYEGNVLKTRVLDNIVIPKHVNPYMGAKHPNPNYPFELARALLTAGMFDEHTPYFIGLEYTSWKRKKVSVDRLQNQRVFGRPSQQIANILSFKAIWAGSMQPHRTADVSPAYDCGNCGVRIQKGTKTIRRVWETSCPSCDKRHEVQEKDDEQQCQRCNHQWFLEAAEITVEELFTCPQCGNSLPAEANRALVVVRRTVEHILGGTVVQSVNDEVEDDSDDDEEAKNFGA
jgi:hypothetical protein